MSYRDLLVTTISVSSVLAANGAVAGESQQKTEYLKLAAIYPLVEVAGDILVSANTQTAAENTEDYCIAKGYEYGATCPPSGDHTQCVTERCQPTGVGYDYIKCACYCNGENTCKEMGYTETSCGAGYTVGDSCFIDPSMVKCVPNPCTGYNYTSCSSGYYSTGTCLSGTTTKHKCSPNPCTGYATSCSSGYVKNTSDTCLSGTTTKYKCIANPCTGYNQTSACSPSNGYTQTTCLSGTTTKYKCVANTCTGYDLTSPCSPASGYTQTTCQAGATTKYRCVAKTCPSDYNLTSPCSPSNGYTQYTCQAGSTTKYKCVANTCSGYYTSCSSGYYLDTNQKCQAGSTTKYKCVANACTGYNLTSPCSPSNGYTQTTCLSGSTTKYKCVANSCTGYDYTSCPSGYTVSASCQAGSTTKYKCSCHSDCHTCTDDLDAMSNVAYTSTESGLKSAISTSNKTVVLLGNVTLSTDIAPASGVKIVGPKYFTSSAKCSALTTPTLNTKNFKVAMNSNTIEDLNLEANRTNTDYSKIMLDGSGTVKDTAIKFKGYAGIIANIDGSGKVMNFEGSTSLYLSTPDSSASQSKIQITNGGKLNINNKFNVTGTHSTKFYLENAGILTVASAGELNYQAGGGSELLEMREAGTKAIFNGPLKAYNLKTVFSYTNFHRILYAVRNTELYLNADGNILDVNGYGFYHSAYGNGGRLEINGTTTINMKYDSDGTRQETAFKIDNGNYNNPEAYMLRITDNVTVTGLETYSGSYAISQADHLIYMLDGHFYLDATLKSSNGYGWYRNVRSSSTMTANSYLEGVNQYEYSIYKHSGGNPKITFNTGAKLKIKTTCKKAHTNTYLQKTTTTGSYSGNWTSPSTSYFGNSCSTTPPPPPPGGCDPLECEIINDCMGRSEPDRTICKTCCRDGGGFECSSYLMCDLL